MAEGMRLAERVLKISPMELKPMLGVGKLLTRKGRWCACMESIEAAVVAAWLRDASNLRSKGQLLCVLGCYTFNYREPPSQRKTCGQRRNILRISLVQNLFLLWLSGKNGLDTQQRPYSNKMWFDNRACR